MSFYMLSGLICAFVVWTLIGRIGSVSPTYGQLPERRRRSDLSRIHSRDGR